MNELIVQKELELYTVPPVAEKLFETSLMDWYEYSIIERPKQVPTLFNDLLFQDIVARDILLPYFNDISAYNYVVHLEGAGAFDELEIDIGEIEFPFKFEGCDNLYQSYNDNYMEMQDELEFAFIVDIKRYFEYHHVFYGDQYQYDFDGWGRPKMKRINLPLSEVW